jgi:hypothetical protein
MSAKWIRSCVAIAVAMLEIGGFPPAWAANDAPWVSQDAAGKLVYRTLPKGDRIVDFSYAGYRAGGVPLPVAVVRRKVMPTGGDDSATIQKAIDEVSALPLMKDGLRGAVLLEPGTFQCRQTLTIAASGVVLRGNGPATVLKLTGDPHMGIAIVGDQHAKVVGTPVHIAQAYVPSGSRTITVDGASGLAVGDTIRITRYTTPQWLHFMGMDRLERDGKDEKWVGPRIETVRAIAAKQGNTLTLDVPLTDSYDRTYLPPEGAEVAKIERTGGIQEDGVESLHMVAPPREVGFSDPLFRAMTLKDVRDAWVRNVVIDDVTEGVEVTDTSTRITIEYVVFHHATAITSSAKPADFALRGGQTLVFRCGSVGNEEMYVITGARNQGPNVVMESVFRGNGHVQPHQRWATGLLVDNVKVPEGGIDLMNRGEMGSGHGWTMGWGVVWNSSAASLVVQMPPGAANWSIGTSGQELGAPMKIIGVHPRDAGPDLPRGFIESAGKPVLPESLYRAQLKERLGADALKALEP